MRARSSPCCFARCSAASALGAGRAARRSTQQLKAARAEQAAAEAETARLEQVAAKRADRSRPASRRAGRRGAGDRGGRSADHRRRRAAAARRRPTSPRTASSSPSEQRPVVARCSPASRSWRGGRRCWRSPTSGGTDELVKVRMLLDSTLPVIRAPHRPTVGRARARASGCEQAALDARAELSRSRERPRRAGGSNSPRSSKARSQQAAARRAARRSAPATSRSPPARHVEQLRRRRAAEQQSIRARSRPQLAAERPAPPRPFAPARAAHRVRRSPTSFPPPRRSPRVSARSNASGVRSRGLTLATGARRAGHARRPTGIVRFAGPVPRL